MNAALQVAIQSGGGRRFKTASASRNAALALLALIVIAVIAAIAVPAWMLYERYDSTARTMARQLKSYTGLNRERPQLMKAVEVLKARDPRKYYVKGATPALAGADLQDVVKSVVEANNGRVLSSQLLPHKDDNGVRLVNATMQMTANIQNLRQILHALETREPYVYLDNLTIRSQVPSGFKPQPGFEPDMFVQFDATGLAQIAPGEAKPTDAKGGNSNSGAGKDSKAGAKP
jgi:general secretion pathway protein M